MAEETDRPVDVYHYTSKENAAAIRESGEIKPSDSGFAGGGKVYLTSKDPSEGKAAIARNNYDGISGSYWEARESQGAVDTHIKLQIPESKLNKVDDPFFGRDIYTHDGSVKLADYEAKKTN